MEGFGIRMGDQGGPIWPDLAEKGFVEGHINEVGVIPNGTSEGNPAVALRVDMPDGKTVIVQTTLRLFGVAADAMRARFPVEDV